MRRLVFHDYTEAPCAICVLVYTNLVGTSRFRIRARGKSFARNAEILQTLLDLFIAITKSISMVLKNDAFAQIKRTAGLLYPLEVGDNISRWPLNS